MNQLQQQISVTGATLTLRNFQTFPTDELRTEVRQAEVLDFSGNQFDDLPANLNEIFPRARVLFLSNTHMESLPSVLASCEGLEMIGARGSGIKWLDVSSLPKSLRVLTLTDNEIDTIPVDISKLSSLEKLNVSGNNIEVVPVELAQCHNLEMMRIASNRLAGEPDMLRDLPKLAWYTDAGNPFSVGRQMTRLPEIAEERLHLGDEIGRSANNRVFRALLDDMSEVAVKVYGAELSTDGAIVDEINALSTAHEAQGVVSALGISQAAGRTAVVMSLVPSEYRQLAAPPDLTVYLRDRYDNKMFTAGEAAMLLDKVYHAVEELHRRGLAHGDIYAHNLLYSGDDVLLGDFGAASLFTPGADVFRRKADRRALGILEQEITSRVR